MWGLLKELAYIVAAILALGVMACIGAVLAFIGTASSAIGLGFVIVVVAVLFVKERFEKNKPGSSP